MAEPVATPAIAPVDNPAGVATPVGLATASVGDELSVVWGTGSDANSVDVIVVGAWDWNTSVDVSMIVVPALRTL